METLNLFKQYQRADYSKLTDAELVIKGRAGDSSAVATLGIRVFPMAMKIARTKNCFIYGEAEVEEAFIHALMYGINHYDIVKPRASFSTAFLQWANSTYAQMHQTASAGKNRQLNTAESLDDLQFMIPDESSNCNEDLVHISNLIDIYTSLADKKIERLNLDKEFLDSNQEDYDVQMQRCNSLIKAVTWKKKKVAAFLQLAGSNNQGFTDEELCIELKLLKFRAKNNSSSLKDEFDRALALAVETGSVMAGRPVLTKGLLSKVGIICDSDKLDVIREECKKLLHYSEGFDVEGYQRQVDQSVYDDMLQQAKIAQVKKEAKDKGMNPIQAAKSFTEDPSSIYSDFRELEKKIQETFLHKHPKTEIEFEAAEMCM